MTQNPSPNHVEDDTSWALKSESTVDIKIGGDKLDINKFALPLVNRASCLPVSVEMVEPSSSNWNLLHSDSICNNIGDEVTPGSEYS